MAVVRTAGAIKKLSGKIGGLVYKWTKEGVQMVDRESPKNPQTSAQMAVRGAFKKASQQWKTLSPENMEAWSNYAKDHLEEQGITDRRFALSGFNWFTRFSSRFFAVNPNATSAPVTPPTSDFAGDAITINAEAGDDGITFTASGANSANVTTALLVQRLVNSGRTPMPNAYRTKVHFKFASGSLSTTVPVAPGYYAVGYEFVSTATGQESPRVLLGKVGPVSLAVRTSKPAKKAA